METLHGRMGMINGIIKRKGQEKGGNASLASMVEKGVARAEEFSLGIGVLSLLVAP
jgi:hypothetical protein